MTAGGIDVQCGRHFLFAQGEEVTDAVDRQYGCVICRQHDEGLRRFGRYLPFERVFLFQFGRRSLSDKVLAGTAVGHAFQHGDDGIEQYLEVGTGSVAAV